MVYFRFANMRIEISIICLLICTGEGGDSKQTKSLSLNFIRSCIKELMCVHAPVLACCLVFNIQLETDFSQVVELK